MTCNIKSGDIQKLRMVLREFKSHILKSDDYFEMIVDTGCSKVVTPHLTYFVSGSLTKLDKKVAMDAIALLLAATHN